MKTIDVTLIPQGKYYISQFDETDVMVDNQIEARTVNPEFAQLIAEAGTVANETGLTPRELLEQRNELLAVLKMVRSNNMQFGLDSSKRRVLRLEPDEWELLDQSIKNTTT